MTDAEIFDGKCPYTDRTCYFEYDCVNCDIEEEEREFTESEEYNETEGN